MNSWVGDRLAGRLDKLNKRFHEKQEIKKVKAGSLVNARALEVARDHILRRES
jgi:hypothetical protein